MRSKLSADSIILQINGVNLINGAYLEVSTGEVVGLLGLNGSGKSSLMRIIYGDLQADGSVCVDGLRYLNSNRPVEDMRFLPQHNFIPPHLKVDEVFRFFGLPFERFAQEFPDLAFCCNLRFKMLSGGERRILEAFLILTANTKFCLLDEPFSQMMPLHIERLSQLIAKEKQHKGILLTDHYYEYVLELCNRIYLLYDGAVRTVTGRDDLREYGYL